jgi:hypothetical protein
MRRLDQGERRPILQYERGVPDPQQDLEIISDPYAQPGGQPPVFETYKGDWEKFRFNGKAPEQWNESHLGSWYATPFEFFLISRAADYQPS